MTYKASWDILAKIVTAGVTLLFIGVALIPYFSEQRADHPASYFIGFLVFLIYLVSYALSPVHYRITSEKLIIHRPWKDVVIDRNDITQVELLDDKQLSWSIRVFGSGGVFGYYGKFYNSKIGKMTWYATRRKNAVLVQTAANKKIILTPDDTSDFANRLQVRHNVLS